MHALIILLVMAIFIHDGSGGPSDEVRLHGFELLGFVLVPKLIVGLTYALACGVVLRRLLRGKLRSLQRLDRVGMMYRFTVILLFAQDLYIGALLSLRELIGDGVLLDELILLVLPLMMFAWSWWVYYPIDRRLREATLIRRLDSGLPIHPIWTRPQFVLTQVRHQIGIVLLPLLLVLGWIELMLIYIPSQKTIFGVGLQPLTQLAGTACVFVLSPLLIRHLLDTAPLPPGSLRRHLRNMCRLHRVRVRELLLWRTFGGLINAAVMGVVGPLRYIMLSDGLIENLPADQVEAVMAHELAHVRRKHLPWLVALTVAVLGLLTLGWSLITQASENTLISPDVIDSSLSTLLGQQGKEIVGSVLVFSFWIVAFGWISRRFERQADVFAIQHLARTYCGPKSGEIIIADEISVGTMITALQKVAELNHIPVTRRSWRHGSIASRQNYLHNLVGSPINRFAIDKQVARLKFAGLVALALLATFILYDFWRN